jgi:hypothetical protein
MNIIKSIILRLGRKIRDDRNRLTEARIRSLREFHDRDPEKFYQYVNNLEETMPIVREGLSWPT